MVDQNDGCTPLRSVIVRWFLTLALFFIPLQTSLASPYAPNLEWQSLKTPHFIIHYADDGQKLAQEAASKLEAMHPTLTAEVGWVPKKPTHVVIVDHTDSANGMAGTVPNNRIIIYATAPTDGSALDYYEDWLTALLVHEYTHILHIDMIGGLPKLLRTLFGRMIMSNDVYPRWVVEGFAVYQESQLTAGGRARSSYGEMVLRMATLEGDIIAMRNAEGFRQDWPAGGIRYLWGGKFITYVAEIYGPESWRAFNEIHGRALNPLAINWHAKQVFGKTLYQLWDEWQLHLQTQFWAQAQALEAKGLRDGAILIEAPGHVGGLDFAPDGQSIYFAKGSAQAAPGIFQLDLNTGEQSLLLPFHAPRTLAVSPHGGSLYYATYPEGQLYTRYQDIYAHGLENDKSIRLTHGARARDPAIHPDGHRLLVITNAMQQNAIEFLTPGGELIPLVPAEGHIQYHKPTWSPDGQHFAVSRWLPGGRRDIAVFNIEGQLQATFGADRAVDTAPTFSPDGRYLLFSSDRTGIPNLFAFDFLGTGQLYQVTEVLGGAFDPKISPDGQKLLFRGYSSLGYDLRIMDFDPRTFSPAPAYAGPIARESITREPLARGPLSKNTPIGEASQQASHPPFPQPTAQPTTEPMARPTALPAGPLAGTTLPNEKPPESWDDFQPYRPWGALFPPRLIAPEFYFAETGYAVFGASTFGRDAIGLHGYRAWLNYRSDAQFLNHGASYQWNRHRTEVSGTFSTQAVYLGQPINYPLPEEPGPTLQGYYPIDYDYYEVRTRATLSANYPLSAQQTALAQLRYECREPLKAIPGDSGAAWDPNPFTCSAPIDEIPPGYFEGGLPDRGNFSGLSLGWRHRFTRSFAQSISPEKGHSLSINAQIQSRFLGSDYERQILVVDWRHYYPMTWAQRLGLYNHVLATRLVAGTAFGDQLGQRNFRLGGSFGNSAFLVVPSDFYPLRGYQTASDTGDRLLLGSVEYRLPLVAINQGLGTLPLYARNTSLTLFTDIGNAFEPINLEGGLVNAGTYAEVLGEMRVGSGVEFIGQAILGYGMALDFRLGYALGWHGGFRGDLGSLYLQLGRAF